MCIKETSRTAADFSYPVTVTHDACATMNLEFEDTIALTTQVHAASMAALGFGNALIRTTEKYLA
jgi:nicotinamidase-related amidase